jgi:elongation factor P--beta-lysine ligase
MKRSGAMFEGKYGIHCRRQLSEASLLRAASWKLRAGIALGLDRITMAVRGRGLVRAFTSQASVQETNGGRTTI